MHVGEQRLQPPGKAPALSKAEQHPPPAEGLPPRQPPGEEPPQRSPPAEELPHQRHLRLPTQVRQPRVPHPQRPQAHQHYSTLRAPGDSLLAVEPRLLPTLAVLRRPRRQMQSQHHCPLPPLVQMVQAPRPQQHQLLSKVRRAHPPKPTAHLQQGTSQVAEAFLHGAPLLEPPTQMRTTPQMSVPRRHPMELQS